MKKSVKKIIKKNTNKKEITTNDLAIMVQKGFSKQIQNFDELKSEMYVFKKETEKHFSGLDSKLFFIDSKLESVDTRLKKVEESLEPILISYGVFSREIRDLNTRVMRIEKKLTLK